jgi:hypothetical protein
MSDFSDAYGLLFVGLVIVLLFITCYKIVLSNDSFIKNQLESDYLASKFKSDLREYNSSANYSKTFALPRFNAFTNAIITVISCE